MAPWTTTSSHLLAVDDNIKSPAPIKSPKPMNSLFLQKPLQGNGSRVSLNDIQQPNTPTGIRAQLGHLLPRHAYFRARVHIQQVSSVPFVSGEFGVRWKFKGVQTNHGAKAKQQLLSRVKGRTEKRKASLDDKGKGREDDADFAARVTQLSVLSPAPGSEDNASRTSDDVPSSAKPSMTHTPSSSSRSSTTPSSEWTTASSSLGISSSLNGSHRTILPSPATNTDGAEPPSPLFLSTTPARGATEFVRLREHCVIWNHTLDTVLKMDIDRDTLQVMNNPLKLVVMQRVIPDDPHGPPQNPRLGAVYLNLAEYIDKGSVERRYLLKESKTNAILKMTIEMEFLSGETVYNAPPLAKVEIMNGLANFLENDTVKKRPRALELYGPYRDQEELEIDLLGATKSIRPPRTAKSDKSGRRPSNGTSPMDSGSEEDDDLEYKLDEEVEVAFDVQRLPIAYGTKTTETLIEAIFNPVKIADPKNESPFTLYQPPSPDGPHCSGTLRGMPPGMRQQAHSIGLGLSGVPPPVSARLNRNRHDGRRQGSSTSDELSWLGDTTSSSAASVHSASSSSRSNTQDSTGGPSGHAIGSMRTSGSLADARVQTGGVTTKNTAGGRVVVTAVDQPVLGGLRGWWARKRQVAASPSSLHK